MAEHHRFVEPTQKYVAIKDERDLRLSMLTEELEIMKKRETDI